MIFAGGFFGTVGLLVFFLRLGIFDTFGRSTRRPCLLEDLFFEYLKASCWQILVLVML